MHCDCDHCDCVGVHRNLRETMLNLIEQHIEWDSVEEPGEEVTSPPVQSRSQQADAPVSSTVYFIAERITV